MKLLDYQKIITKILNDTFDERESDNIFKYVVEEYYNEKYVIIKSYIINDDEVEDLNEIFEKVSANYPIQYIFNKAYFYDVELYVDENVLIPRPETEELVHLILKENTNNNLKVLDIGTGSGCIPIVLKKHKQNWSVSAIDISNEAIEVANKNATNNNVKVDFLLDDIFNLNNHFSNLDIIVSNPPYIPFVQQDLMTENTLQYEPELALFVPNENPLMYYQTIFELAKNALAENGRVYVEINEFLSVETKSLALKYNFSVVEIIKDLSNKDRILRIEL
ncbi:MAG: peptide chain release factor N(5)-glutamine methyltransferase [Sphingobacteriales bacterium]|nr:MAG: peptide chain release factor N(5)-glutamine methyltransferase [Sphingobacteriales bacterium]